MYTFLFFSDGIGTRKNPIRSGGVGVRILREFLLALGPKASSCKGCKSKSDSTVGQDLAKTFGKKEASTLPFLTFPKTNGSPLKINSWKMNFPLRWPIFRGVCC